MSQPDKYVLFNGTVSNISFDISLVDSKDCEHLPFYKRRKMISSNTISVHIPVGSSVDLVELTGLSFFELDKHKDVVSIRKRVGSPLVLDHSRMTYEIPEDKYFFPSDEIIDFAETCVIPENTIISNNLTEALNTVCEGEEFDKAAKEDMIAEKSYVRKAGRPKLNIDVNEPKKKPPRKKYSKSSKLLKNDSSKQ
jgi:hypothetical protein